MWETVKPILGAIVRSPKFLALAVGLGGAIALKIGLEPGSVEPFVTQGIDLLAGALGAGAAVAANGAARAEAEEPKK